MAAVINSATLDQAAYLSGEIMTLTVDYTADRTITVATIVTDAGGNSSAPVIATALCGDIEVTSDPVRIWDLVSDNGTVATFTAVA